LEKIQSCSDRPAERSPSFLRIGFIFLLFLLVEAAAAASASGAPLFEDDFNRTTGLGSNWRVTAGSFTTDGASAQSGGTANAAAVVPGLGTDDYTVEATVTIPAGSIYSGIIARGRSDSQFSSDLYSLQLSTQGTVNLYRRNAGVWTLLRSAPAGIAAGPAYSIALKVSGSNPVDLAVTLNGAALFSYQDAAAARILSGVPGMINYNAAVKYDRLAVSAATVPPPSNQPPAAKITANPISGVAPLKVSFNGATSSDPDGTISSYLWNFGD
jgi:hypothetical protein